MAHRNLRLHEVNVALEYFQKAAEEEPENPQTMIEIARCLFQLSDDLGAIEKCDQALQQKPSYAAAHAYRALPLAQVGRLQEAAEELHPRHAEAYLNAGWALQSLSDYEAAIAEYQKAVKLKPDCVEAHDALGCAHLKNGDRDAAMEELQKVEGLDAAFDSALRDELAEGKERD
jgi:protein O-GlcNAc transferase